MLSAFVSWLIGGAIGPAAVGLPVNWAAEQLADAAQHWFKRVRQTDDLSRLVKAATGTSVGLTRDEVGALRELLENRDTWAVLGHGTVDALAGKIAICLPGRDGPDTRAAAMTIARGLLEFAVADLEPEVFQQVLMARLDRMAKAQADGDRARDEALLGLHLDIVAVREELRLVRDRLPPGPAQLSEIVVYLRTLIEWLSRDRWPRDWEGSHQLSPVAIKRKLRVSGQDEPDLDADQLVAQCRRLVIRGDPGSGKTWLAKRAARRCAEEALAAITAGRALDEVELPLYTTCSLLFRAAGDIREATAASAIDPLPDMGPGHSAAALRTFFIARDAPTLLVLDSLDEGRGSDDLLWRADSLPWRIVLTTRPSSWRNQLTIKDPDPSSRGSTGRSGLVGDLQPLRYPGDVWSFILQWFAGQPERGVDLIAQIARRPDLQRSASVPLILAYYCILGDGQQLPQHRRDLYGKVLRRILAGRWHGADNAGRDVDACLAELRAWAWSGAAAHPVSGVGTWPDEIGAERSRLAPADTEAADHIATPVGRPDDDTGLTPRRFIHRTLREYLVAEYVAGLSADQAVTELLPHLWYDPDWEYSAPAAVALHPDRSQLLRHLMCRAARSDRIPADISGIDAGIECRGFLAQAASESSEDDWAAEMAAVIGQARVELARNGHMEHIAWVAGWPASNRRAREMLLDSLARQTDHVAAIELARRLTQLEPTTEDRHRARDVLFGLLSSLTDSWPAGELVTSLAELTASAQDKSQVREELLGLLDRCEDAPLAAELACGAARFDPTAGQKQQAREVLLRLLGRQLNGQAAARLAITLVQLDPTAADTQQAREVLLGLLGRQLNGRAAARLAITLARLDPTAADIRQARGTLAEFLTRDAVRTPAPPHPRIANPHVSPVPWASLARSSSVSEEVDAMVGIAQTADEKYQTRQAFLELLASQDESAMAADLAGGLARLDPTVEDEQRARAMLLRSLTGQGGVAAAQRWNAVVPLNPTPQDKDQARAALLGLLTSPACGLAEATSLTQAIVRLDPTAEDIRLTRNALLTFPAAQADGFAAETLMRWMVRLNPETDDKRQAWDMLFGFVTQETNGWLAADLAEVMVQLEPTEEDGSHGRHLLLGLLSRETNGSLAGRLATVLGQLGPTANEACQARDTLLRLLAEGNATPETLSGLARLDPLVKDLSDWRRWAIAPTRELLAAARLNSTLDDWLEALPSLPSIGPGFPAQRTASWSLPLAPSS